MKVLVTGGTGFFGQAVSPIDASGHPVTAISRRAPIHSISGIGYVAADIQDAASVRNAIAVARR